MRRMVTAWILVLVLLLGGMSALAERPATDRAGNPIAIPAKVERIVSLAPSVTQVVVDLGLGEAVVGVDTFSVGIAGVPEGIPAFDMLAPDAEQIIALQPDVVFVSGMTMVAGENPLKKLSDLGICVAYIPSSDSIESILQDILFIGEALCKADAAQALNDALNETIATLRKETDTPQTVYFEINPAPYLYSFGTGTFLNEIIELLGGKNILADQESWVAVSEEAIIAANPEIIFTNVSWEGDAVANILARKGWENVSAVQNGKVFLIDADATSQPNHRIVKALEEMSGAFEK